MNNIRKLKLTKKPVTIPEYDSKPLSTNDALGLLATSLGQQFELNEARLVVLEAIYKTLDTAPKRRRKVTDKSAVDKQLALRAG